MHGGPAAAVVPCGWHWLCQPGRACFLRCPRMGTAPAGGCPASAQCVVTMERHQQAPQCFGNTDWKGSSLFWGPGLGMLGCGLGVGPGEFWGSAWHPRGGQSQNRCCPAECRHPSALPKNSCYPRVQTGKLRLGEASSRDQSETTKKR